MDNHFPFKRSEAREFIGGTLFRASKKNFPVLRGLAIQALSLKESAVREPHIHPNAEQLDYCVSGKAQVGIVGPDGYRQLLVLEAGDISFVPQGYVHWIENIGEAPLEFIVILSHEEPETIELSEILAGVSKDTLAKVLSIPTELLDHLPKKAVVISGNGSEVMQTAPSQ